MPRILRAEKDMPDDRGSQGNQEAIKGDSTPKRGQEEKVDKSKVREDKKSAKQEFGNIMLRTNKRSIAKAFRQKKPCKIS
jgi:hypothetical protein